MMTSSLLMMCVAIYGAGSDRPTEKQAPVAASVVDSLAEDLKGLEHRDFRIREAAAQRVVSRRIEAVPALVELAQSGRAEGSVRAFEVLRQLHRDGDEETFEAVESAYDSLALSEDIAVASRAESAIEAVAEVRHKRALRAFRKLGGLVQFRQEEEPTEDAPAPPIHAVMLNSQWRGGDDGLKYLRRLEDFRTRLQFQQPTAIYFIRGAKVSEEALESLKVSFGNAVVERGPACLGVMQKQDLGDDVLRIDQVVAESAAGRAGLQPDDVILEFDDVSIPNFKTLVEQIGQRKPGDKIRILYSRSGKQMTTTAELLEWTLPPVLKEPRF